MDCSIELLTLKTTVGFTIIPLLRQQVFRVCGSFISNPREMRAFGRWVQILKDMNPSLNLTTNYSYNSVGIRERNITAQEIDTSNVILCLGDSFTEGIGAPQGSSYVRLLDTMLKIKNKNVLCVNGGISGSDVFFEFHKLEKILYNTYKPQKVIISINDSDISDITFRGGSGRFLANGYLRYRSSAPWWEYIYSWSYICRIIAHQVFDINYIVPIQNGIKNPTKLCSL
jgi:hypothetical protein